MTRRKSPYAVLASLCSVLLLITACGSGADAHSHATQPVGDPVVGGSARIVQVREPVTLDPAILANNWVGQAMLGNALFGTLLIDDPSTLEVEHRLATDFSTGDGGSTFTLSLRPDLVFSDGTPFDAEAVAFNWERLRDPAVASNSLAQASQIASTQVVDDTTLRITMASPNPHFAHAITSSSLNWIASPTALRKGPDAFNTAPVGAGPFVLTEWARQDRMELERNPDYWDAPRPYLDSITLITVSDVNQRTNVLAGGAADLAAESSWSALARAQQAGLLTEIVPEGGGQYIALNARRAPFDDVRARNAVASALQLDGIDSVVFEGDGDVPDTLFPESSPFFADVPLQQHDPEEAQRLFDELAAEGKPVEFTFTATSLVEIRTVAETVQAQLGAYDNVEVNVEVLDYAAFMPRYAARDFDATIWSANVQEPHTTLWHQFHSDSSGNVAGIADPELDAALEAGRLGTSPDERVAAYTTVQQRLADLDVGIWYVRAAPSVVHHPRLQGVRMYALGSPLPEELWINVAE
ncbi:ABC transporter substrate-binding protein [Rhodococcus rhodochrous]|uniref:ABC transporter substrate-binding protein n=1 Tax=Rhodococcus rhodochrous TaxID=1829 RepID=A0AA47AB42_RHORH|nr:ABC transporter substrate-binding protein [Rhodococcus rhodochrous]UZF45740.1 ABC transporter substrate-binding protein [Rhodococcus rhodochrous]